MFIDIVLGAHMDPGRTHYGQFDCTSFDLEQLSGGGKPVNSEYLSLLRESAYIDYPPNNVLAYRDPG